MIFIVNIQSHTGICGKWVQEDCRSDCEERMMDEFLATLSMCIAFLFLFEGIEITIKSKANIVYEVTHILYPLFIVGTLFYFLGGGVVK